MIRIVFVSIFFLFANAATAQKIRVKQDTVVAIDSVLIFADRKVKMKVEKGKYIINVNKTDFQDTENTWEGLKLIPLLRVRENEALKVRTKIAIIEINGNQIQLGAAELENYIKSLDAKTVKKIEINANPGASYSSEVESVINIVLLQENNNYRVSTSLNNGVRTNYLNNSNATVTYNRDKLKLYGSYSYNLNQNVNIATIRSEIAGGPFINLNSRENVQRQSNQFYFNLKYTINEKSEIDFTSTGAFSESNSIGINNGNSFLRTINSDSRGNNFQFGQVYKRVLKDSTQLKIGSYQVFNRNNVNIRANTNLQAPEKQAVKSTLPLIIGFLNLDKLTAFGDISYGTRFSGIGIEKDNFSFINDSFTNNPYLYNENILSFYINNALALSEQSSLVIGVRSETSFINFDFKDNNNQSALNREFNYTNLLYNLSYSYVNQKEYYHTISFRKQIQRPNYSFLNPFLNISSDITFFSGNTNINPSKDYTFGYEGVKNDISWYAQTGLLVDFISTFTDEVDGQIIDTYRNFNNVFFAGLGFEYNPTVIKNVWYPTIRADLNYAQLNDSDFGDIRQSTPIMNFDLSNVIKLGKKSQFNVNYNITPTYKDGLFKHFTTQSFDLTFSHRFNKDFTAFVYGYDLLQTSVSWDETTLSNYFYGANRYNDIRRVGITLRWSKTGKTYKQRTIDGLKDDSIDRLK